jgi:pimeloyl-ACP methyl ester carboxylesterase
MEREKRGAVETATGSRAGAAAGSAWFLDRVRVPTRLIQSADDPFLPARALPRAAIEANPWLAAAITRGSGHTGFIEEQPWSPRFRVEQEAARLLADQLQRRAGQQFLRGPGRSVLAAPLEHQPPAEQRSR